MAKRKLTKRQAWRIEKIQSERVKRAAKREQSLDQEINEGSLGTEIKGLVCARYGQFVEVESIDEPGNPQQCHIRANLGSLVTGDNVIWRRGNPCGVVVAVLPRSSELIRPATHGQIKTIAANVDRIFTVIAPQPRPHVNLIDRYLVAAETLSIEPVILLNKSDAINSENRDYLAFLKNLYSRIGYTFLTVSSKSGEGIEELIEYLTGHMSVFSGQSGVGKSSLVNAILPDANTRVGALSKAADKGTHTTTAAQLFHLPNGGKLIDSPGIREFGLWHMDKQQLLEGFTEFRPFIGHCKFRNCTHLDEPGCAITAAFNDGSITRERMDSYRHILASLDQNLK